MSSLSPQSLKIEMRKKLRADIMSLPEDYLSDSDDGLFRIVTSLEEFINARNIMLYYSVEREPATLGIAEAALSAGKTIVFPYCFRGGIMQARIVRDLSELRPSMLNIPAPPDSAPVMMPEDLDLVIVPALTYDKSGYRIGYGGGYYDRYLRGIAAFTTGLARQRLLVDELPVERHDIAVDCVVTESLVLRVGIQSGGLKRM